jgi:hypothetical protein
MKNLPWQIEKIIGVANALQRTGRSGGSTGEIIAAAFVLNRMEFLPHSYRDVIEAWERIEDWQKLVKYTKRNCMHLIDEAG